MGTRDTAWLLMWAQQLDGDGRFTLRHFHSSLELIGYLMDYYMRREFFAAYNFIDEE